MEFLATFSESIIYLLVFFIVVGETGVIALFFLPGDTLLFSLGMFASQGIVSLPIIIGVLFTASVIGNIVGYTLGRLVRDYHHKSTILSKIPAHYIAKTERF